MYCVKTITPTLTWVGGNDRRLAMFEGVYSVPAGVSYNSYVLMDEKIAIFDTVDKAVAGVFFENLEHVLGSRKPDYLIVHHMEPDHSATIYDLVLRYPDVKIVCNLKILAMIKQFFSFDIDARAVVVNEGDTLSLGEHTLRFLLVGSSMPLDLHLRRRQSRLREEAGEEFLSSLLNRQAYCF